MMNARRGMLLLTVLFPLLAFMVPAITQQGDGIIVNDADDVREESVSVSQDLVDRIGVVGPRTVLQYANELRYLGLGAIPSALQTLLGQVSDRIVLQYANANRQESLVYPATLFNDITPPQISDIGVRPIVSGSATITWTTDEFATSTVVYGTQPGVYPHTVGDPLYTKQHEITLTGLTPGTKYYYRVRSTDRSGNMATSSEHSFTAHLYICLPLVLRNF